MMHHPLVKKEWRSLKWVMLLYGFIFGLWALILSNNLAQEKTSHLLRQYDRSIFTKKLYGISPLMMPLLLIAMMVVVGVLFSHDRNIQISKFIHSLPYTRKEQFRIKYLMGLMTFTIPMGVFIGLSYFIRGRHQNWIRQIYQYSPLGDLLEKQDRVGTLLLWFMFVWLVMVAAYSFLMMVQTLIGQNILASIIGGITLLVPVFLGYAIPVNLNLLRMGMENFAYIEKLTRGAEIFLLGRPNFKIMGNINMVNNHDLFGHYTNLYGRYNYRSFPLYMMVLILFIAISVGLSDYFTAQNDVEKNGEIPLYPWVGKLLLMGITVCSLLLLPIIIGVFTGIDHPLVVVSSMLIGGGLGFFLSKKGMEITANHG